MISLILVLTISLMIIELIKEIGLCGFIDNQSAKEQDSPCSATRTLFCPVEGSATETMREQVAWGQGSNLLHLHLKAHA